MERPIVPHRIQTVFEGRIFKVQVESITLPSGGRMDAEIIRHPGSVVIIPTTANGDIVLVRQYRHAIGRWAWELPAGSLKHGEEPRPAAAGMRDLPPGWDQRTPSGKVEDSAP